MKRMQAGLRGMGALALGILGVAASGSAPTSTITVGAPVTLFPGAFFSYESVSLALADLNGDGLADLVVSGAAGSSGPTVYYNNGTANPYQNVTGIVLPPYQPGGMLAAVGDVNGDGHPDVVVGGSTIYLNNGTATPFSGVNGIALGGSSGNSVVGDVNGDGFADIVVYGGGGYPFLYLTKGAPLTSAAIPNPLVIGGPGYTSLDAKLADVNGDGKLDLVVAYGLAGPQMGVQIYLNNGTSSPFSSAPLKILTGQNMQAIAVVDVNGDGKADIVAAGNGLSVWLNNGSKTQPFSSGLTLPSSRNTGAACAGISVADLNGDGFPDLQFACQQPQFNAVPADPTPAFGAVYLNNGTASPFTGAVPIDVPSPIPASGKYYGAGAGAVVAGPIVRNGAPLLLFAASGDDPGPAVYEYPVPLQQHPVAANDWAVCGLNGSCVVNVLADDRAVPGQSLNAGSFTITSGPAHGTVTFNAATGSVTYKPVTGYSGADAFQYTVRDAQGNVSNAATVSVSVTPPPVAANDSVSLTGGPSVRVAVLSNDTSSGGSIDPTSVKIVTAPLHGTAQLLGGGVVLYTPVTGYTGLDTFKYTVQDNFKNVSNVATATVNVTVPASPYTSVNLGAGYNRFNTFAIVSNGHVAQNGGLDGHGFALPSALTGSSITWDGATFPLGAADVADADSNSGIINPPFPFANFGALKILATAANGPQLNQTITLAYSDNTEQKFTQSFSEWGAAHNYPGESIAATASYRITPSGSQQAGAWHVYGYTIPVDPTRTLVGIYGPNNRNVVILAASLEAPPSATAVPQPFFDFPGAYALSDGQPDSIGLDGQGDDYSSQLLGTYLVWSGIPFQMPQINGPGAAGPGMHSLGGGYYSKLYLLGTGYKGAQINQTLVITYADGTTQKVTQSFSDWGAPQNFPNESIATTMAYRYRADGSKQAGNWNLYAYTIPLDATKVITDITIPSAHITALAFTLAQ